jgi:hypothetical protein
MNKYVCRLDGAEFLNEDDLVMYLKKNFVDIVGTTENENGQSIEKIYKAFKIALPDNVVINVKTDTEDKGFMVNIDSPFCDFSCQIGEGEWNYYYNRFYEVKPAVEYYKTYFQVADEIIGKVKDKYGLDLVVRQMWESSGEGEQQISFTFMINGEEESECYEFDDIDSFVNNFEQYVSNTLMGNLEIVRKEYHTEYKIGGVSIEGFAKRNKKVRLEIVE